MLLSKVTYSAFSLYVFYQYVCFLGIEPTTFCAVNTMLYHWATGTQYSWSLSVSGHNSSVAVPPDLSGSSGGRGCDWLGLAGLHPAPASLQPGDPEQRGTQRQAGQRSLRQTQHSSEEPEPGLLSVPEAHSGPHWEGLPGAQKLQLQGQGSIHTDVSFIA